MKNARKKKFKLHEERALRAREDERKHNVRKEKRGEYSRGRRGGRSQQWNGATYQNDYLLLPFTLIDKSCYVNEWGWHGGLMAVGGRGTTRCRTRGGRAALVRITRKLRILRLCIARSFQESIREIFNPRSVKY